MMDDGNSLILVHYGVKGMKWGVRRKSSTSGSKPRAKKPKKYVSPQKRAAQVAAALWVGKFMLNVAKDVTPFLIGTAVNSHQAAQGAAFAASMLADRGLTNYKTVVIG